MKKLELKTLIREVVREEVQLAMREMIKENKIVSKRATTKPKPVKKKVQPTPEATQTFSKNPVLNDILRETARDGDDWPTLGDQVMTTANMDQIVNRQSPDSTSAQGPNSEIVQSMGVNPNRIPDHVTNALTKDYRGVMKVVDQKISSRKVSGGIS